MNYLQIWLGEKPDKKILDCMNTVLDKVDVNDTYTLISDINFLNNKKVNWINIKEYEKIIEKDELLFKVYSFLPNSGYNKYLILSHKSDLIRLHYLSNYDDVLYCDTDVILKEKIKFENNKPHFALEVHKCKDSFISWNGNNKELFKNIIKIIVSKCYDSRRDKYRVGNMQRGWIYEIINFIYDSNSEVVDNKYFEHLNMYEKRS